MEPRVLFREGEPCLASDRTVLNFLSSIQLVHKQLIRPPVCSCCQN